MAKETLSTKNTVFFSTADDSYIFQAATSLLSIRQFQPQAELYILSRYISPKNKKLLDSKNIKYIELDLTYLFFQTWDYPIECYYLFAGPKIFKKLGFKYSVYLDGDTICLKDPIKDCPPIHDIGGVKANKHEDLFSKEKNIYSDKLHIPLKLFSQYRINSGIVYMNNAALVKLDFLETCGTIFHKTWLTGFPRKGDDSIFALFQLVKAHELSPIVLDDEYNYIPNYKGFEINDSIIFFHFSFDKPWKYHPYQHENSSQNIFNGYIKNWRSIGRKHFFWKWFNTLSLPITCAHKSKGFKKELIHKVFVLKRIQISNKRKVGNSRKTPIKLYWWEPPHLQNFGDVLSQELIKNLFGFETTWEPIETCELIAVGSIVEVAEQAKRKKPMHSWGSGFIRSDSSNENLKNIKFAAIRGQKSMSRIGYSVPTGDPGLLINAAYSLKRKRRSKKIGVVIHYADLGTPTAKKFCKDPRFDVITPLDTPQNVAQKIADWGLVLSSSLHGLIFADSLSIPNYHIKISYNLTGGTYKFLDYYSGINKEYLPADVKKIFDDQYLAQLKASYKPIHNLTKIQRKLVKAFPFN